MKLRSWVPVSIAWWPVGEGRRVATSSQSASGWKLIIGVIRSSLRLGIAFNCFGTLSFRGRPCQGGTACLAVCNQDSADCCCVPKGQGIQTTSTNVWVWSHLQGWALHLHHSPESSTSRRGNYPGQRCHLEPPPASAASKGLYPWPKEGIWCQDSCWWALVKTPAFEALDGDRNLSDRGLKIPRAHLSRRDFACLMQLAREKKIEELNMQAVNNGSSERGSEPEEGENSLNHLL